MVGSLLCLCPLSAFVQWAVSPGGLLSMEIRGVGRETQKGMYNGGLHCW